MDYQIKKNKAYRIGKIGLRCTEKEKNQLQIKANLYTKGNLSEYVLFAALNYAVKRNDLEKGGKAPH